jgi:hypothetical protein
VLRGPGAMPLAVALTEGLGLSELMRQNPLCVSANMRPQAGNCIVRALNHSCEVEVHCEAKLVFELFREIAILQPFGYALDKLPTLSFVDLRMLEATTHHGARSTMPNTACFRKHELDAAISGKWYLKKNAIRKFLQLLL